MTMQSHPCLVFTFVPEIFFIFHFYCTQSDDQISNIKNGHGVLVQYASVYCITIQTRCTTVYEHIIIMIMQSCCWRYSQTRYSHFYIFMRIFVQNRSCWRLTVRFLYDFCTIYSKLFPRRWHLMFTGAWCLWSHPYVSIILRCHCMQFEFMWW